MKKSTVAVVFSLLLIANMPVPASAAESETVLISHFDASNYPSESTFWPNEILAANHGEFSDHPMITGDCPAHVKFDYSDSSSIDPTRFVSVVDVAQLDDTFSIEMYVYLLRSEPTVLFSWLDSNNQAKYSVVSTGGEIGFTTHSDDLYGAGVVLSGAWNHLIFVMKTAAGEANLQSIALNGETLQLSQTGDELAANRELSGLEKFSVLFQEQLQLRALGNLAFLKIHRGELAAASAFQDAFPGKSVGTTPFVEDDEVVVTYHANDGGSETYPQTLSSVGDDTLLPPALERQGYSVRQWRQNPDGTGSSAQPGQTVNDEQVYESEFPISFDCDVNLYADWQVFDESTYSYSPLPLSNLSDTDLTISPNDLRPWEAPVSLFASAFERNLSPNIIRPQLRNSLEVDPEEYVYRITDSEIITTGETFDAQALVVDGQSIENYTPLTKAAQDAWYVNSTLAGADYEFNWNIIICVVYTAEGINFVHPSSARIRYISIEDGLLPNTNLDSAYSRYFYETYASDTRTIVGYSQIESGQETYPYGVFQGQTVQGYIGAAKFGISEIIADCPEDGELSAIAITNDGELVTSKDLTIGETVEFQYNDEEGGISGTQYIPSENALIAVTGESGPLFNAALWGVTLFGSQQQTVEITLDSNGGSPLDVINLQPGDVLEQPATNPTLDGYSFSGWSTVKNDASTKITEWSFVPEGNLTLFALWTAIPQTPSGDSGNQSNGSGSSSSTPTVSLPPTPTLKTVQVLSITQAMGSTLIIEGTFLDQILSTWIGSRQIAFRIVNQGQLSLDIPGLQDGTYTIELRYQTGKLEQTLSVATKQLGVVNAGTFGGVVAIYARGYQGQRLSAKVGRDWIVVDAIPENFLRLTERVLPGRVVSIRIFIDRKLVRTIGLTTR